MKAQDEQLWPWLRVLIAAAALATLTGCSLWVSEAYTKAAVFRQAPACEGQSGDDCVAKVPGTVTDKDSFDHCTSDQSGAISCTFLFELRVRYGDRTEDLEVSSRTYRDVRRGDRAVLGTWRDAVVSLEARGHTHTYDSPADDDVKKRLVAVWPILGVGLWAVGSGRRASVPWHFFTWCLLSVPLAFLVHGALLGASAWVWVIAGAAVLVVLGVMLPLRELTWASHGGARPS